MNARRSNADKRIARFKIFAGNKLILFADTYREACKVVFLIGHKAGMLCGFAAHKRTACLNAAVCHALNDFGDFSG